MNKKLTCGIAVLALVVISGTVIVLKNKEIKTQESLGVYQDEDGEFVEVNSFRLFAKPSMNNEKRVIFDYYEYLSFLYKFGVHVPIGEYGPEYFETRGIAIIYVTVPTLSSTLSHERAEIVGDKVKITYIKHINYSFDSLSGYFIIAEIPQNITRIEVERTVRSNRWEEYFRPEM